MKKAIVLNAGPGSGKDTAYELITRNIVTKAIQEKDKMPPFRHLMFKEKLFRLVLEIFDISEEDFFDLYNNRETKELQTRMLRGVSPREAMIYVSENVIKPNFGKEYFGEMAARKLINGINIFTDGGFEEELNPIYESCNGNLTILRIHREGYNFQNDSRGLIQSYKDVTIADVNNPENDIDGFSRNLWVAVYDFIYN